MRVHTIPGRVISWILIAALLNCTVACRYYTYQRDTDPGMQKLAALREAPRYIIVHQADAAWHLSKVVVDNNKLEMLGDLETLPVEHLSYNKTKPTPGTANRYLKNKNSGNKYASPDVVNEVHFYIDDVNKYSDGDSITIPLDKIKKIEIYDSDTGANVAANAFLVLGGAATVFAIITIIVLLTKSSCPFVFIDGGKGYQFTSEIYSGAIFKCIERDDYMLLPNNFIKSGIDTLSISVANKLKEKQYINTLKVLQLQHAPGIRAMIDRNGKPHSIDQIVRLSNAIANNTDITRLLSGHDSSNFEFNLGSGEDHFNEIILTFPKDKVVTEGHLIMNAKNTLWGDYVFGEFTKLFGSRYTSWVERQNNADRSEHENWAVDQGLAMKVYVEKNGEWEYVDQADLVGPLAFRDLVVPIDLSQHQGSEIRVKLSAGFMMWDMDYVAMDYSSDEGITINSIDPFAATDDLGNDVRQLLAASDTSYVQQLKTGDHMTAQFLLSEREGYQYDYVLQSRGYYNHVRDYEGMPEITTLLGFKEAGRFSRFSKEKFDEMQLLMNKAEFISGPREIKPTTASE